MNTDRRQLMAGAASEAEVNAVCEQIIGVEVRRVIHN
jgi:hypothetical protein